MQESGCKIQTRNWTKLLAEVARCQGDGCPWTPMVRDTSCCVCRSADTGVKAGRTTTPEPTFGSGLGSTAG